MLNIGFGLKNESALIMDSVKEVLKEGFRTIDIADSTSNPDRILGTNEMGEKIIEQLIHLKKSKSKKADTIQPSS